MKSVALTFLLWGGMLTGMLVANASPPPPWQLPKNRATYLMEDDLVYARFLSLASGGTYQQINRDARGSAEVDRGRWDQGADGVLRLHSTCKALQPRALQSGPLSVIVAGQDRLETLPKLLASLRRFLAEYGDAVFAAGTVAEIGVPDAPPVQMERGSATFTRDDVDALAARIAETVASERNGTYVLEPVKGAAFPLYALSGSAFREADLPNVKRISKLDAPTVLPFYFAPIEGSTYAREVGHWQPLHLPGSIE